MSRTGTRRSELKWLADDNEMITLDDALSFLNDIEDDVNAIRKKFDCQAENLDIADVFHAIEELSDALY